MGTWSVDPGIMHTWTLKERSSRRSWAARRGQRGCWGWCRGCWPWWRCRGTQRPRGQRARWWGSSRVRWAASQGSAWASWVRSRRLPAWGRPWGRTGREDDKSCTMAETSPAAGASPVGRDLGRSWCRRPGRWGADWCRRGLPQWRRAWTPWRGSYWTEGMRERRRLPSGCFSAAVGQGFYRAERGDPGLLWA